MQTNQIELLTTKQAAKALNLHPSTLEKWRWRGEGPPFVKLGTKAVRYTKTALEAFMSGGPDEQ